MSVRSVARTEDIPSRPLVDQFLYACLRADRADARRLLDDDPGLLAQLDENDRTTLIRAAETGNNGAVALMLDLGSPLETRGENGATALHTAAYSGGPDTVRLLLDRAADIAARDTTWDSTPLDWAIVGSGEQPTTNPHADWVETVRDFRQRDGQFPTLFELKDYGAGVSNLARVRQVIERMEAIS